MKHVLSILVACSALSPLALGQAPDKPAGDAPPAAQPAKPKVYDESADVREQIAAALAAAKRDNKRVLIQWGGNWCPWCIRMHQLMTSDKKIGQTLLYEYVLVHADCGRPNAKNVDVAEMYGAKVKESGFPYLTILDSTGHPLANQATRDLEVGELDAGHDPAKVLAFLNDHVADRIDAEAILAKGLSTAKSADRRVFLHFGSPTCIWCRRLEAWMAKPVITAILAKDFVDVKIDTARNTGGQELLDKMSSKKSDGIPWIVFLDGAGKPLASATDEGANVGFPGDPKEIERFGHMLNKAAKNMKPEDVKTLIESLKIAAKANATADKPTSN